MTTTVTITTAEGDKGSSWSIIVGDRAQKHVLRTFNVTSDPKVDATKVLCAALIQQMIDLHDRPTAQASDRVRAQQRAAERAIEMIEQVQMQTVKANFVEA